MGSITERPDGKYLLRASLGKDPTTGKYRQASKVLALPNKTAAKRELRKFEDEVSNGRYSGSRYSTMDWLLDRWLRLEGKSLSPTTLRTYENYADNRIRPALGTKMLHEVTPSDLRDLYGALEDEGLKPATIGQIHSIIRRAFHYGITEDLLDRNPAGRVRPPKIVRDDLGIPSIEQVRLLIAEAEKRFPELAAYVFLSAFIGARRGEMSALRWNAVDLDTQTVRIWKAIVHLQRKAKREPKSWLEKSPKTRKPRTVSIGAPAVAVFKKHREHAEWKAKRFNTTLAPDAFVFSADERGERPWLPDEITKAFRSLASEAGLTVRLHDLRHFSVATLLTHGVDVKTVADRHGHANPNVTLNVYAHWLEAADRQASDVMGELMGATESPKALESGEG